MLLEKGLFLEIPVMIGTPGLSRTNIDVPLGPIPSRIFLSLLARTELLVLGTVKVAVAPLALNQDYLSGFIIRDLCSLDL